MNRPVYAYLGQILLYGVALLGLANLACTSYTAGTQRTMSVPLPPPPSISPKRASVQVFSTVATAAEGELADAYILPHMFGVGGAVRITRFLSVRLNGLVGLGPSQRTTTSPEPSGAPFVFGPGVVFQSPMLAHRVELFAALDVGAAVVPTAGVACEPFGGSCRDEEWLAFPTQLSLELGLRVWLKRGRFAAHLAGTVVNQPHLDTLHDRNDIWAGVTRLHLQWLPHANVELILGGGTRFTSGPVYYGSSGVGLQLDAAVRIHFGNAL